MKKVFNSIFSVCVFAYIMLPILALAHVKWFVDTSDVISSQHGKIPFYYLTSIEVLVWSAISIIVVVLFSIFDRIIPEPKALLRFSEKHSTAITRISSAILGLYLISVTFLWKIILVPEVPIDSDTTYILGLIQILAGLLFITGRYIRQASILTFLLYIYIGVVTGPLILFENALLLSLLIYFFIQYSPQTSTWDYLRKASIEIVRIGTGVTLIVLAFTEKLMYPELGLHFLSVHDWNFMQHLGVHWFTDTLFVLSTGFAEMIFGVIFILGYLTRINTIAIASFFAASVVTMFVQFGAWEVEDLVVYSAAILFICYGHGHTKFFHVIPEKSFLRRIHIGTLFRR